MPELRHRRIAHELFLLGFGADALRLEPWVTDRLTALLEEEDAVAGQTLFRRGEAPDSFYFVRRGRLRMFRDTPPGSSSFEELEGRCIVGLSDGLLERARTRTAVATTDLEVMSLRTDGWLELLEDSFEMARLTTAGLAGRALELQSRCRGRPAPPSRDVVAPDAEHPLDLVERMALLRSAAPLERAGVQVLSDLAASSSEVAFDAGDPLYRRGQVRDRLFVGIRGVAEATFTRPDLRLRTGPGQVVGWPAIYTEEVACDAIARTSLRALAIPYEAWLDAMEEHFDMVRAALAALTTDHETWSQELTEARGGAGA